MKRLTFCFTALALLIAGTVGAYRVIEVPEAAAKLNVIMAGAVVAAGGAYCTSSTSDGTNTYLLCEDFEGDTSCGTGEGSVCRKTYTISESYGERLTFNTSSPANGCAGNYSVFLDSYDAGSTSTNLYSTFSEQAQFTVLFYFYISAESLADTEILSLFEASMTGSLAFNARVKQISDDSTLRVLYAYHDGSSDVVVPATETDAKQVSLNTWYRIKMKWDNTNNVQEFCSADKDGSNEVCHNYTSGITRNAAGYKFFGTANQMVEGYIDNIRIMSGTSYPGTCD